MLEPDGPGGEVEYPGGNRTRGKQEEKHEPDQSDDSNAEPDGPCRSR